MQKCYNIQLVKLGQYHMNIYLSVKSNVGLVAGYVDCECGRVKHGALANTRSCLQVASICGLALRL